MKALSLTRPWTWFVLHGGKDVENRVWQTSYRGPLLVHGALSKDFDAITPFMDLLDASARAAFVDALIEDAEGTVNATGLLGVVQVVGCCTAEMDGAGSCTCGPWAMPGQAHWQLAQPRPFAEPIPCKGRLGLWTPAPDVLERVAEVAG